jgi:small ligand-binding sensory domain FIST
MCGGHIPEGAKIRFSLPPDFDIVVTVIESARNLKEQTLPEADALLIFSCIGRQVTLGPLIDEEIKGLNEVWNIPMTGYFSLGEFGAVKGGKATFHGTTCSWVALKEK